MKLLLLSSSRVEGFGYLQHAIEDIRAHLGAAKRLTFIPYAGVTVSYDAYLAMVSSALSPLGYQIQSIHQMQSTKHAILESDAILVGGGNTFCLLNQLYQNDLLEPIREAVISGIPYIGWSAGSNLAGATIKTTNDMPIIEPSSFDALNLLPFQINPHYLDGNPPGHQGETREQRINEFLVVNPDAKVVGLPEGTALRRMDQQLTYLGDKPGFLFDRVMGKVSLQDGQDLSHLLND